jgi:DnaJ like chaperone protein
MMIFFSRFRVQGVHFSRICRCLAGPLFGGLVGLLGGIPGVFIGVLLGGLIQQLLGQFFMDKDIMRYLEDPGRSTFDEGTPGLAAYCALGTILLSQSVQAPGASGRKGKPEGDGLIARSVIHSVFSVFPGLGARELLMETFCRLALSMQDRLNPDLLAESLAARRSGLGDLPLLGRELESLARGDRVLREAAYIRAILDPVENAGTSRQGGQPTLNQGAGDPWRILGLKPGASQEEIKSCFRKLAVLFHPDALQSLDEKHRQNATKIFILIKDAYRELIRIPRRNY